MSDRGRVQSRYYVAKNLSHDIEPDPLRWFVFDRDEANGYLENPGPRLLAICLAEVDAARVCAALNMIATAHMYSPEEAEALMVEAARSQAEGPSDD